MYQFKAEPKTILRQSVKSSFLKNSTKLKQSNDLSSIRIQTNYIPMTESQIISDSTVNTYFTVNKKPEATYIPLAPKVDKATQINKKDWLLFDFEYESEPVVEVLVANILDQSRVELLNELN